MDAACREAPVVTDSVSRLQIGQARLALGGVVVEQRGDGLHLVVDLGVTGLSITVPLDPRSEAALLELLQRRKPGEATP